MKRLIAILLLSVVFIFQYSFAEFDLSRMELSDLLALRGAVDTAIWNSDEWEATVLPVGAYIIGEDVPAGRWVIRAHGDGFSTVVYGEGLSGYDHVDTLQENGRVCPSALALDSPGYTHSYRWSLIEGYMLVIRDAPVELFRPLETGIEFE